MKLSKKTVFIIASSVLLSGLLVFVFENQQTKANLLANLASQEYKDLLIIESNSISAISNPSYPEPKVAQTIHMIITAYSSTVSQTDNDPFITASNTWVREGIIANNLLPFGTKVRIPELYGNKIFVVEDRMNRKKGYYHVDIWFPDYLTAKEFGAKRAYVEILES